MNLKAPKLDIKDLLVLNIDEGILEKLCFRETLLISCSESVDNERECLPFVEKCSETCPNEEQCDEPHESDDLDKELFQSKAVSSNEDYQDNKRRSLHEAEALRKREKFERARMKCKRTKSCPVKDALSPSTEQSSDAVKKIDDRDIDHDYSIQGEVESPKSPKEIRILQLGISNTSGGFCVNVENVGQHLLLYLASQFGAHGYTAGSTILSTSDLNFTLIEERKTEFILRPNDKVEEKCLHVALDENNYIVLKSHKFGNDIERDSGKLQFENAKDLLFDGAGIILMRYLAITNFRGKVELSTMLINGDVARMIIQSSGYKKAWLCNTLQTVIEIEKIIIENCGIEHKSLTVLTTAGCIIKHEWDGCDYIIHINPISDVPITIAGLSLTWESDIELFSRFLDYKSKRKAAYKSYMIDTPEVRSIVSDYVEYILLTKPSDILNYTIDYFKCLRPY